MDEINQPSLIEGIPSKSTIDHQRPEALVAFELLLKDLPFSDQYAAMMERGLNWREAAVVGWGILPKDKRKPATKKELAVMLGCSPARISGILSRDYVQAFMTKLALAAYGDALPDIIQASIDVASTDSYKATPERALIYKVTGVMGPDKLVVSPGHTQDLTQLTDDQLAEMAGEGHYE